MFVCMPVCVCVRLCGCLTIQPTAAPYFFLTIHHLTEREGEGVVNSSGNKLEASITVRMRKASINLTMDQFTGEGTAEMPVYMRVRARACVCVLERNANSMTQ